MRKKLKSDPPSTLPAPVLSPDIELRPRYAEPVGLGPLLEPRLKDFVHQLEATLLDLKSLGDQAPNFGAKAVVKAKLADLLVKVIKLGKQACPALGTAGHGEITNLDVPDWARLSAETQQGLSFWLKRAREEFEEH